ncbi:hypothetical protein QBC45DRAFT_418058 [Copromyces sp. CBS 386.78]|nr:hypothetical protein QBC45DRAFT_418058 [Copromyces sp. CBS 386.78]
MYSRKDYNATECSRWMYNEDDKDTTSATLKHLEYLPPSAAAPLPASSSNGKLPRTSRARLSQPDVSPTPFPDEPILLRRTTEAGRSDSDLPPSSSTSTTVLYLAYGSNMCAETFLGMRKIRPLSQVVVSAPSIRLTFDLPGIPYLEPCFANIALRRLPKKPPVVPIPPLDPPHLPPPGPQPPAKGFSSEESSGSGNGDWSMDTGGLIGVVYEVTAEDYARILATEGGGASYHEILVPCIELPAPVRIPEHPRPELPKPFLARTLYAPQLTDLPDDPKHPSPKPPNSYSTFTDDMDPHHPSDPKDPKDPNKPQPPQMPPKWRQRLSKLLLPIRRPQTPRPTQPSLRYLTLLRTGAIEHELPPFYIRYLEDLEPYTITSCRQQIGRLFFMVIWMPLFFFVLKATRWVADDKGKIPGWIAGGMTVMMHFLWGSYDWVFKPAFGEGERTVHDDDDDDDKDGEKNEKGWVNGRRISGSWLARRRSEVVVDDEEKWCLLSKLAEDE